MTSNDTHARTAALLAENANYGLDPSQVFLVQQQAVPCLANGAAALALDPNDRYRLLTKPNGHGEVYIASTSVYTYTCAYTYIHLYIYIYTYI